ncbi:MAG: family 20 glycosylhydrolase [Gemmatimonadaceae bacterium]|nr:family 20 glycosylhydrolase [Chitinophagaceae bacterium]
MKHRIALLVLSVLVVAGSVYAQSFDTTLALIPQPVSLVRGQGVFTLPANAVIETNGPQTIARMLAVRLSRSTGYNIEVKDKLSISGATIRLEIATDKSISKEGYRLTVTGGTVKIVSNDPAGLFYGTQTLVQLFPAAIENFSKVKKDRWTVPAVTITDYPRFGWRGLMLDVVRHWFTKQQVKDFIDEMVQYKYNLLHLHLTDDQGWRIEIKSLPMLTQTGAWRAERVGRWGDFTKPTPDEPKTYGGFYTHEDIRELLAYAKERYVTIMPEIDVPGHSLAAVASYPELTCTPGTYQVNAGERFMHWPGDGTFYGTLDNTLCPANEKVYAFLDKVFTEIAQLFPFEYIHMGGDECYKGFWEKSEAVKDLMKREKLKDMHEVQSYFVKRVEKIISSKGKKMMGWDEILDGGIAPGASVMSWQGMKGGIEAAKLNHQVVMSPNTHTYVDLYQGDPIAEPVTYSMVRLSQTYKFDPLPPGVDPKYILGGQGNLWSERLNTVRHLQYMLWPRGFAVSESVWSQPAAKDWNNFVGRVEKHFVRYDSAGKNYSRSMYDPIFTAKKDAAGNLLIALSTEVDGLAIHYTFDEFFPDKFFPVYKQPLSIPKEAANLRVITYRDGLPVGKMITMPIAEMRKRKVVN